MYAFEGMIELANQKWKSAAHKKVAVALLIGNHRITTRQELIDLRSVINNLSQNKVESLTLADAVYLGIPVN